MTISIIDVEPARAPLSSERLKSEGFKTFAAAIKRAFVPDRFGLAEKGLDIMHNKIYNIMMISFLAFCGEKDSACPLPKSAFEHWPWNLLIFAA